MLEFQEMIQAPLRNRYKGWKETWCNKKSGNNCIGLFLKEGQKRTTRPGSTRASLLMMLTRYAPKLAILPRTDSNESNEQPEAQHRTVKYGEHLFEAMLTSLVRICHRLSSFRPVTTSRATYVSSADRIIGLGSGTCNELYCPTTYSIASIRFRLSLSPLTERAQWLSTSQYEYSKWFLFPTPKRRESVDQTKKDGSQMKVKGEVNFGPKQACIPSASKAKGKRLVADLDGSKEEEEGSPIEDSSSFPTDSDIVFGEETKRATFNHTNAKD
ncbi:hypothetical protein M9H77_23535 [Catharanthus roseus]|uniref:Uncharacterized protein n=1 Tax=Catharanthus roseus TaxID=4058 RepID=A0ACC0AT66_CATRO|nr:hypothetical protein M9H77_23535 [Catharanthus roseus]